MVQKSFWKDRKVFLTGHTGFKGAWLTFWLNRLGARVHGFSLLPPTQPSLYEGAGIEADCAVSTIGDIRNLERLSAALTASGSDIVIHMAAQPLVLRSYVDPIETYATNVMGTANLLQAVRSTPSVRSVVVVTTDKCYENREWSHPYRESDRLGGHDPYSNSKACCELVVDSFRKSFFGRDSHCAIGSARAGNVIGGGDWAENRLVPDLIRGLADGRPVEIRRPSSVRPWQHVLEPLSGYLLLAERLWQDGDAFAEGWNFGPVPDAACPVSVVADGICRRWGRPDGWFTPQGLDLPHEAGLLQLDISKSRSRLGWAPRWDMEQTLDAVAAGYRATGQGGLRAVLAEQIDAFTRVRQPRRAKQEYA